MAVNWSELFPTKSTFLIFILYMSLFVGQGIFVTASQEPNNSYSYNTVLVVLMTEMVKFIVSVSLYCRENKLTSLPNDLVKDTQVMILYFVPAFLYCLYNNLAFVNLSTFDPTTYYLLLQLRVVITGLLFQVIFKKYLSKRQWISLVLLTAGCMIKEINFKDLFSTANDDAMTPLTKDPAVNQIKDEQISSFVAGKNLNGFDLSMSAVLILAQTICSCLAGVYNEYLLKDKGAEINIFVQNIFMYMNSVVCNLLVLLVNGELFSALSYESFEKLYRFKVLIIIINNAAIGIVTSFFLKYMNSILKTFASALELMFTAILCYFLFSIPIYLNTALAIAVVSFAIYLYSQSPVVNLGRVRPSTSTNLTKSNQNSLERRKFLNSEDDTDSEIDMV